MFIGRILLSQGIATVLIIEHLLLFVEQIALALMLVYAYSAFSREALRPRTVNIAMGSIFGICAIAAMLQPIELATGIIIDIRSLLVGMAAALFGLLSGAIALAFAVATRFALGGDGAVPGAVGMVIATLAGLCWRNWVQPKTKKENLSFLILGVMISGHMAGVVLLPDTVRVMFLTQIAPILIVANLVGAFFLAKLISREQGFFDEQRQLQTAARFDPLTGLLNRTAAVEAYRDPASRSDQSLGTAMICIDVDYFKQVNDHYGHLCGDEVLVRIARRMSDCLRPQDIFARMSGDEFIIILDNLRAEDAVSIAGRCKDSISRKPMQVADQTIGVSVSIGCAWVAGRPDFETFRNAADQALYRAKGDGRDKVAFDNAPDLDELAGVAA